MESSPQSSSIDVLVIGGSGLDYLIRAAELPSRGRSATGDAFCRDTGGKGLNQAVAAARLGARATLISCIGADSAGDEILHTLTDAGVDTKGVRRVANVSTARTLINVDTHGQKQTASYPGANGELREEHLIPELFSRATVVLAQLEVPTTTVLHAARLARAADRPFVLDAGPATGIPDDLLRLATVVTANGEEATALSQVQVDGRNSAFAAARAICAGGARHVSVGISEGRAVVSEGNERWLPSHRVAVVDTTGAGDACAAGIAVSLAEGRSFITSSVIGHAAAALATTVLGARASLPFRAEVDTLLARDPEE
jgi:ribokinase